MSTCDRSFLMSFSDRFEIRGVDRDAVPRRDLGDAGFARRRDHVLVPIPPRGVLQEPDLDALAHDDRRLVRLVDVLSSARVGDAVGVEHAEAPDDVVSTRRHVVGDADDRDVRERERLHAIRSRVCPLWFVGDVDLGAGRRDEQAFEVRVDEVGLLQRVAHAHECRRRIRAPRVHLDVADDEHLDGALAVCPAPFPSSVCGHRSARRRERDNRPDHPPSM